MNRMQPGTFYGCTGVVTCLKTELFGKLQMIQGLSGTAAVESSRFIEDEDDRHLLAVRQN
jgi:hypothetical protein